MKSKVTVCGIITIVTAIVLIAVVSASSFESLTAHVAQFGVFVNGEERIFENPIVTINDRTYVPLREIGEVLGMDVEWDGENRKIIINSLQMPTAQDEEINTLYEFEQDNNIKKWDTLYVFEQDGLWGYKDAYGNVIIEPQFVVARSFFEGLAFVNDDAGQRGFIDVLGNLVISLPTGFPGNFSQGFARVAMGGWDYEDACMDMILSGPMHRSLREPFVFIDRMGENVFGMEFLLATDFEENGLAMVLLRDRSVASIDRAGNIVDTSD